MRDDELRAMYQEINADSYMLKWHSLKCGRILDEIVRVQNARHESWKRNELRDALILFLKNNANLGRSLEYAADRIADAIENAGGSFSSSVEQIGSIIRDVQSDVSESELPRLISEMRKAIALRNDARRRLT
jgi:hypothetical protein